MKATTLMRESLRQALGEFGAQLERLEHRVSVDAVHEGRAAARKLRELVVAFPGARLALLKEEAGALKDAFGRVRDLQVKGAPHGAQFDAAVEALHAAVGHWVRLGPALEEEIANASVKGRAGGRRAQNVLRARLKRLTRQIDTLGAAPAPRVAHRLRIKLKRARNVALVLAPGETGLARALRRSSGPLGQLHDLDAGLRAADHSRPELLRALAPRLESTRREIAQFLDRD